MANRSNEPSGYSKEKMLFLRDMFAEHSDTENGLRMVDIQDKVEREYGIRPDRKTIISDIDVLESYGVEIQRAAGGRKDYRLLKGKDELNVMEVKILIDLIQSSRFLPPAISKRLIRKLEKLCSVHERKTLQRKVIVPNRERSENTNILYAMNSIHEAIEADKQIKFKYYGYDIDKKKTYHHWGNKYRVSPYALIYREGVYTLVAIPAKDNRIRMYRVDHMEEVEISHADRHEKAVFDAINLEEFSNGTFGLSFKPQCEVTLNAHVSLIDAIIDRFGMDVKLTSVSDEVCSFTVPVTLSPEFFGWVLSFGGRMKLISPSKAKMLFRSTCYRIDPPKFNRSRYLESYED